ncbi:hypothetical protein ACI7YT_12510 [Microbacterium sp. M]|uniref:hypothetical protein n=1 Tax=Microbacterium sp. M TaxID=3377125 RepID=UPI00386A2CB0
MSTTSTPSTHQTAGLPRVPEHALPAKIYAAVIEWPEPLSDASPGLILARSESERDAAIYLEILETADALTEPDWREAIAATNSTDWRDWIEPLELTPYGNPFITNYERTV